VKQTKSKPRRVLWARPAPGAVRLPPEDVRPTWRGLTLSVLLHGAALGVAFAWTPQVIEVVRTYEVDLVKVQPVVALNAEPPMPAAKQAEPPPKPPEPKRERPPPKPEPVIVAAVAKPAPTPLPPMPSLASVVPSPLRIAMPSTPAAAPASVAAAAPATNAAPAVAAGNDTEEVSDQAYLNTVRAAVKRHLRYPELALRRGVEGRVVLRLTLDAAGRLLDSGAGTPEGDAALLSAALAAVKRAAPFPPWQGAHDAGATLNLTLPIRFTLEGR
jgi:protein TonB